MPCRCDVIQEKVEAISIDGKYRSEIPLRTSSPFGLATYGFRVLYTDRHTQQMYATRLGTELDDPPVYIGVDKNRSEQSSQSMHSYIHGNFYSKLIIMSKDLSSVDSLIDTHECSPKAAHQKTCSHVCVLSLSSSKGHCMCPDGFDLSPSDSKTCVAQQICRPSQFNCSDGTCITKDYQCDGIPDCKNGEDETFCDEVKTCRETDFVCVTDKVCIPSTWQCDRER